MFKLDEKALLDYIKDNYDNPDNSVKDLVLMTMGLHHLENTNDFFISVNTAFTGTAVIIGLIVTAPVLLAGSITAGIAGCVGIIKRGVKIKKIKSLQVKIADKLIKKHVSFIEAYVEIANMISSIEKEDLIQFFAKANALK